ncbi:MAG: hypothetical protein RI897_3226 [Verrucomicrobiota bacterium]
MAVGVEGGMVEEVVYMGCGAGDDCDIAMDTAEAPFILVFEVGGVGEAVDLDGDEVGAGLEVGGEVEFCGGFAVLGGADEVSVEVEFEVGFDAIEDHVSGAIVPGVWEFK